MRVLVNIIRLHTQDGIVLRAVISSRLDITGQTSGYKRSLHIPLMSEGGSVVLLVPSERPAGFLRRTCFTAGSHIDSSSYKF